MPNYVDYAERVAEVRAQMGLGIGWFDDDAGRMVYPPGNARLTHLASLIADNELRGPHHPAVCPTHYLRWVDAGQDHARSPEPCCEAWEAVAFTSCAIAWAWRET